MNFRDDSYGLKMCQAQARAINVLRCRDTFKSPNFRRKDLRQTISHDKVLDFQVGGSSAIQVVTYRSALSHALAEPELAHMRPQNNSGKLGCVSYILSLREM